MHSISLFGFHFGVDMLLGMILMFLSVDVYDYTAAVIATVPLLTTPARWITCHLTVQWKINKKCSVH